MPSIMHMRTFPSVRCDITGHYLMHDSEVVAALEFCNRT